MVVRPAPGAKAADTLFLGYRTLKLYLRMSPHPKDLPSTDGGRDD
jgi:hypothetical protein